MELENVAHDGRVHLRLVSWAPLPEAVARLAADALTQLRAAVEHTLFAQVEHELGRSLEGAEARAIEMPAHDEEPDFDTWLKQRKRPAIAPLAKGSPLERRIRDLQPFHRHDQSAEHPLRVLAEHTNLAKHRTPAVAATRLGRAISDISHPEIEIHEFPEDHVVGPGDTLVSLPAGLYTGVDIWPEVSILRPHSQRWKNLLWELRDIEDWVRTVAIPHLIIGRHDVRPLPPHLDISRAYRSIPEALAAAGPETAGQRAKMRIRAAAARSGLKDLLVPLSQANIVNPWVDGMSDAAVVEQLIALHDAAQLGPHEAKAEVMNALASATVGQKGNDA